MKKLIFALSLTIVTSMAVADTVAQAISTQGHKVRLTDERCTVISGRSQERGWGRTYSWLDSGITVTGCGRLDNDTVLIEWFTPEGLDIRRYSVDDFTWTPKR